MKTYIIIGMIVVISLIVIAATSKKGLPPVHDWLDVLATILVFMWYIATWPAIIITFIYWFAKALKEILEESD